MRYFEIRERCRLVLLCQLEYREEKVMVPAAVVDLLLCSGTAQPVYRWYTRYQVGWLSHFKTRQGLSHSLSSLSLSSPSLLPLEQQEVRTPAVSTQPTARSGPRIWCDRGPLWRRIRLSSQVQIERLRARTRQSSACNSTPSSPCSYARRRRAPSRPPSGGSFSALPLRRKSPRGVSSLYEAEAEREPEEAVAARVPPRALGIWTATSQPPATGEAEQGRPDLASLSRSPSPGSLLRPPWCPRWHRLVPPPGCVGVVGLRCVPCEIRRR